MAEQNQSVNIYEIQIQAAKSVAGFCDLYCTIINQLIRERDSLKAEIDSLKAPPA